MNATTSGFVATLVSYFVGALPFGYLLARLREGIDIRQRGSGNIGATNVARILGLRWGILVLLMDALKGALPVYLLPRLFLTSSADPAFVHISVLCGMATVIGHMFPIYLGFRGGKGVATSLGVVAVLAPWSTLISVGVYLLTLLLFRIPSVASMVASVAFAIARLALTTDAFSSQEWSCTLFSLLAPVMIIIRHRANIGRILKGVEPRFQFGRKSAAAGNAAGSSAVEEPASDSPHAPVTQDEAVGVVLNTSQASDEPISAASNGHVGTDPAERIGSPQNGHVDANRLAGDVAAVAKQATSLEQPSTARDETPTSTSP